MAEIKTLQTRIALKYDSYAAWTDESVAGKGANLVLLPGEIGICEIKDPNAASNVAPTVLFKVGGAKNDDGSLKTFKQLPWASAKAADVYSWAKASDVVLEGKTIKFVGTDKKIEIPYVTDAEVKAITNPLSERVAAVEAALGVDSGSENSVSARLGAAEEAIETLTGEGVGSVKKAEADAKKYTDDREAAIKTAYEAYADQAEADALTEAKKYADAEVLKDRNRLQALEEADAAQDLLIAANTKAVEDEADAREAADALINEKFGATYSKDATVAAAIADAKLAGTNAQAAADALNAENGPIKANTKAIAANAEAIAANDTAIEAEVTRATGVEADFKTRIEKMEAFFDGATEDSDGLNNALDTLKEIQDLLSMEEGAAAGDLLAAIKENAEAIDALEGVVGDETNGLVKDLKAAEEAIGALEADVDALETLTAGFAKGETIKAKIEAAQTQADKGVEDAGKAQAAADKAQGEVDALEQVVGNETTGLAATKAIADKNKEDIAAVAGRMTTAEADIDALEAIVKTGADKNEALRADITELQGIVKTGADANATLGGEIDALAAKVNHETTGLAATKVIADGAASKANKNAEDIGAIQGDYLKMADLFIIDCGTSTVNVHERPNA